MTNRNKKIAKKVFLNHGQRVWRPNYFIYAADRIVSICNFTLSLSGLTGQSRHRRILLDSPNKSGNDIWLTWAPMKRGFSLIEIVTALAILVIGLVSILALFPVGFQASGRAADYTKAAIFVQEKMEEIKMKGFDNAKSETEEDTGNTEGKFTRRVSITDVQEDKGYLKEVIVTVSWKERGKSCEKEFRTYIADYTP